jgi:hypothetical protein
MNRRSSKRTWNLAELLRRNAGLIAGEGSGLKIGKRGVYLISGDAKLAQFRLIGWQQIVQRLQA